LTENLRANIRGRKRYSHAESPRKMAPTLSFVQVFRQRSSSDASLTLFLKRLTRNASVVVIARRRDQRFSQAPAADEASQAAKWIWIASSASFASRSVAPASSQ
jgi:hypothetical protein